MQSAPVVKRFSFDVGSLTVLFCFVFFLNVPYVKNCSSSVGGDLICHIMWDAGLNLDPTGAWFVSWTSS